MRTKIKGNLLSATNAQQALSFLVDHPGEELLATEIQSMTKLSKAGTYRALDTLVKKGVVEKLKKGRFAFYRILENDCFVRQFKVLKMVSVLKPLVTRLQDSSRKIVLYGSASRGEDYLDSDIDLFIIARDFHQVEKLLSSFKSKRKLQGVIKTMVEVSDMEETDPEFIAEVNAGVVLWRENRDS